VLATPVFFLLGKTNQLPGFSAGSDYFQFSDYDFCSHNLEKGWEMESANFQSSQSA